MILNQDQLKQVVLNNNPDYTKNVEYEQALNLIVNGHNYLKYLVELSNLENDKQKKLREKYSKSTKGLAGNITRPFHNIFTAIGGSRDYLYKKGTETTHKKATRELNKNMIESPMNGTPEVFMENIWSKRVIDSPRSTILIEVSDDGKYSYPVFKCAKTITNWKYKGYFDYEFIVFYEGTYKYNDVDVDVYRVIDDSKDYSIIKFKDKEEIKIIELNEPISIENENGIKVEFKTIPNYWAKVPCIQLTSMIDTDMRNKISLLDPVIELFNENLLDDSIKRLFKFLHGYPYFSEFDNRSCPECGGTGKYRADGSECNSCGGTGLRKKDVSNVQSIEIPDKEEYLITPSEWAAYIAPSIETWAQMNKDLEVNEQKIMFTVWGSIIDIKDNKQYSTLGARILDAKPINDVLTKYSKIGQTVDKKITEFIGSYLNDNFESAVILYGNFYLTYTPDQLLEKYEKLLEKKASYQDLDKAISDYYHTLYSKDPKMLAVAIKDINYEPYRHNTITEVESFSIDETTKNRKRYYQLYRKTISIVEFLKFSSIEEFNKELDKYILKQQQSLIPVGGAKE